MKKKKILIVIILLLVIVLIPTAVFSWKIYQKKCRVMSLRNEGYIYILSIEGEFRYTPNKVKVIDMEVDERMLLMDVVLYNEYHKGEELTVEQLLEEYDNFCNNSGSTEGLDAFRNFDRADTYDAQEHPLRNYNNLINQYLNETYGIKYDYQATLEQLEEAAEYAAKKWREDPGEYYR